MHELVVYETLETPVRWRSAVPGYILTAGTDNNIRLRVQHCPGTAECVNIESGSLLITMRRMLDLPCVAIRFPEVKIPANVDYVDVSLPVSKTFRRGYYRLHIVHRNGEGKDIAVYNAYVVVDSSTEPQRDAHLEVNSVRTQFADLCEDDNKMLDGLEIGVGDIAEAVERCIQQWNNTAPRVSTYYGDNFPWPETLRNGVMSMLLQSVCTLMDRNKLTYQAEGVAVDLEARADRYKALRQEYVTLWRSGMMQAKMEDNVHAFTGQVVYE